MKKLVFSGLMLAAFSLLISGCVTTKASGKPIADYSRISGTHTINFSFELEKGYKGIAPYRDLTSEEFDERQAGTATPLSDYEIYKEDQLVFEVRYTAPGVPLGPGLPSLYEQQREQSRRYGTLQEEGSTELYEYFLNRRIDAEHQDQPLYVYTAVFKDLEGPGFSAGSYISREEAEKCFKSMTVWFTNRQMMLKNITVAQEAKNVEADYYPEKSSSACHMVVNYVSGKIVSSTNPDLIDDHSVYEEKAYQELMDYVDKGRTETELEIGWK